MFAISSGLVSYQVHELFLRGYMFLPFEDGREIRQINPLKQ